MWTIWLSGRQRIQVAQGIYSRAQKKPTHSCNILRKRFSRCESNEAKFVIHSLPPSYLLPFSNMNYYFNFWICLNWTWIESTTYSVYINYLFIFKLLIKLICHILNAQILLFLMRRHPWIYYFEFFFLSTFHDH